MNKKFLVIGVVVVLVLLGLGFAKGLFSGEVVLEEEVSEGVGLEKCLSCSKAASCPNYGNCKGGVHEGTEEGENCGLH